MASTVSVFSSQDEDIKEFTEATKDQRIGLAAWKRISASKKTNETSLAEELEHTVRDMENFVADLENDIKKMKFRRVSLGSDVYDNCKIINNDINNKIEVGMIVMEKVMDVVGLRHKKDIENTSLAEGSISESITLDPDRQIIKERIGMLNNYMKSLLARFAGVLDEQGIPHKYPVPKVPAMTLPIPAYEVREPQEFLASKALAKLKQAKEQKRVTLIEPSTLVTTKEKIRDVLKLKSPLQFLEQYGRQNNLKIELTQVRTTKTVWFTEYIFTCKIFNIVGEGRGKSRELAKQEAVSQVISSIISKQKRGVLPPELPSLTAKEMDIGNSLLCEAMNYEEELVDICSKENYRPPIFSTVSKTPMHVVRCNALSVSAVGKGKTKEIARRMACKNVIEAAMDEKRKSKEASKISRDELSLWYYNL